MVIFWLTEETRLYSLDLNFLWLATIDSKRPLKSANGRIRSLSR